MHPAQPSEARQTLQRNLGAKMIVHILQLSLEPPFLQRPHASAGGPFGMLRSDMPAELPGQDCQAQGIRADSGVTVLRGFDCL